MLLLHFHRSLLMRLSSSSFFSTKSNHFRCASSTDSASYDRSEHLLPKDKRYPHKWDLKHHLVDLRNQFDTLGHEETAFDVNIATAGRVTSLRKASKKLIFFHIMQQNHLMQIKADFNLYEDNGDFEFVSQRMKKGDVVGVKGHMTRTKAGELSIMATHIEMLAPTLRSQATKQGLQNIHCQFSNQRRQRQRYLALLKDESLRSSLITRSRVMQSLRKFLDSLNFLEVETPILDTRVGGASATPFVTQWDDKHKLYLRIAPELHLKQLVVGGFDRVYEIGKQFRNEGLDTTHNPEFTSCEFYMAYADYFDVANLTEKLLRTVVKEICEDTRITYIVNERPVLIDFQSKFNRLDYFAALDTALGDDHLPSPQEIDEDSLEVRRRLYQMCCKRGITVNNKETDDDENNFSSEVDCGRLMDKLFSKLVQPSLIQPTLIMDYPQISSPLAKRHRGEAFKTERFEVYVAGMELVNAYTEENNPETLMLSLRRQLEKVDLKQSAHERDIDVEFLSSLKYGLPPTAGFGLGVDRLVMLLTHQKSIKDVIAFPMIKDDERYTSLDT